MGHRSLRSEDRAPFLALVNSPLNAGRPYSDLPRGRPSPLLVSLVQSGYTTPRPSIIGGAPGGASSSQFWSQASRIVSFAGLCRVLRLLSWLPFRCLRRPSPTRFDPRCAALKTWITLSGFFERQKDRLVGARRSFPVSHYRHHAGSWKPLQSNYISFFLSFFLCNPPEHFGGSLHLSCSGLGPSRCQQSR